MGKYRSRSGCLTCRARRVKCDETKPICNACKKKNRPCQWEAPHTKFKDYQPTERSPSTALTNGDEDENMEIDSDGIDGDGVDGGDSQTVSSGSQLVRDNSRSDSHVATSASAATPSSSGIQRSPSSPFLITGSTSSAGGVPSGNLQFLRLEEGRRTFKDPITLTHDEALLVHHYTEHLGRWLDCTDATRQFTLGVPEKVKKCPVLCHAVLSFAARHRRDDVTAEAAYQHCIALLIDRLNDDTASHDETLLCAIVILRFYEQLNVPSSTGSDDEQHLAGCSAILRASQGHHFVDPSAPSLREAAFWVYVRQCLYNATINQQPPDIDFSLQLHPAPGSMQDSHPLARLRLETAWANQMTWYTACVVNFCFEGNEPQDERTHKLGRWQELWDSVHTWAEERPNGFDPIWQGPASDHGIFPEIWFTTDWHVVSFGFYHFSCILLLSYKPGPKFAIRSSGRLSEVDRQILEHARAICGACKSSPETVPISITLCHTIFIWGPLVADPQERTEVLQLLVKFESTHLWPTTWIINALKAEWGTD
ncbi:hypothetical protein P153DRAFT_227166 [Dothidotthia symphoricarpi CBS 119687]|uniref:Zn(2)-C6 fungal-type domain-containing protein n=1 Tax=Dothidotthia symphoricarpi CBS 119687 TaxID=1392245 RepID=A0A6A6AHL5_9PLEO|nr:uncharacterized protein P153DRAFT_227166 [Dothidotthia symphoricarpi CBS 119687]KAF2129921.1 hypothetical protein P153DRAFT_227166 [Dothidotthia symphoricarpi CBS 119687]